MAGLDFRIWATIHQTAPSEFAVTVSAMPDDPNSLERPRVILRIAATREIAEAIQRELSLKMGAALRAGGNRIVDLEE